MQVIQFNSSNVVAFPGHWHGPILRPVPSGLEAPQGKLLKISSFVPRPPSVA